GGFVEPAPVILFATARRSVNVHHRWIDALGNIGEVHRSGKISRRPRASPPGHRSRRARDHRRRGQPTGENHADEERDGRRKRDGDEGESAHLSFQLPATSFQPRATSYQLPAEGPWLSDSIISVRNWSSVSVCTPSAAALSSLVPASSPTTT